MPQTKAQSSRVKEGTHFMLGNYALVEGAISAGCDFFGGYPITPANEISEMMSKRLPEVGGKFMQGEDELCSIYACAGAALSGAKAMTATASAGFNYMQEGLGYCYTVEAPVVIADVQRCRGENYASQADVMQMRYNEAAYKQLMVSLLRDYYDTHGESSNHVSYSRQQLSNTDYLEFEKEANRVRYIDLKVREMTPYSKNVMLNSDMDGIAKRRRHNYEHLYNGLRNIEGISVLSEPLDKDGGIVPFGLVVLTEKRDRLFANLAEQGIIGEIQWVLPSEYYEPGEDARWLSDHNLMIHCDQRYTSQDMDLILKKIPQCL